MTTAIEVTKREMYSDLERVKRMISDGCLPRRVFPIFEEAIEAHLEALRQDRAALVTERDTLRNRVQVLEMANATSGEVIRGLKEEARQARKNFMAARLAEVAASVSVPPYNASGATLDGNADDIRELRSKEIAEMVEKHEDMKAKHEEQKRNHEKMALALQTAIMSIGLRANLALWSALAGSPQKETCMHSFHPAFPSGELCTFCGVGK